jgi:hypothetical protein
MTNMVKTALTALAFWLLLLAQAGATIHIT